MMQNTSHAAWKKLSALLVLPLLAVVTLSAGVAAAQPEEIIRPRLCPRMVSIT